MEEDIPAPTDAQLETYYQDNSQNYQSPLVRKITYAWLSPDMLLDDIDVAEEDLKASYELQIERFDRPGFRNMDRIVFANDEEAATARAGLDAGDSGIRRYCHRTRVKRGGYTTWGS